MSRRYIFIRRRRQVPGGPLAVAIVLLFALAVWAGTGPDPQLPPIYLKAAPIEAPLGE